MATNPYGTGDPLLSIPAFNNPYASPLTYLNQPGRPPPQLPPVGPNPTGPASFPAGAYQSQPSGNPTGVPSFPTSAPSGLQGTGFMTGPTTIPPARVQAMPVSLPPPQRGGGPQVTPNPAAQPSWWQQMFGLGGNRGMTAMLMDRAGGSQSGATRI
jgi:hypothetical protein